MAGNLWGMVCAWRLDNEWQLPRKSSAVVHKVRVDFNLKIVVDLSNEKILNSACVLNYVVAKNTSLGSPWGSW